MKILCGTNLKPASALAVQRAGRLANELSATLRVVHAVPRIGLPWGDSLQRARRRLQALTATSGGRVASDVRMGSAPHVLYEVARELEADLVILGASRSRSSGAPHTGAAGRTAAHLLKRLDCPLLIVRREHAASYQRVLMILDCGGSEELVRATARLALRDAQICVTHAHEALCTGKAPADDLHAEVRRLRPELLVVGADGRGWGHRTPIGEGLEEALAAGNVDVLAVPRLRSCVAPMRYRVTPQRAEGRRIAIGAGTHAASPKAEQLGFGCVDWFLYGR